MKLLKNQILILFLALPLMSCISEIAPEKTEKEIISEISSTWSCEMVEDGISYAGFDIIITPATNDDTKIIISNFHKSGEVVTGFVSKDLMITIPEQQIGEQYFKGTGEISNDYSRITWNYTIENAGGIVVVTGISTYGGEV